MQSSTIFNLLMWKWINWSWSSVPTSIEWYHCLWIDCFCEPCATDYDKTRIHKKAHYTQYTQLRNRSQWTLLPLYTYIFVIPLISGLVSNDELVKRDILTLLATLTLHSATAYKYVLDSFSHFKVGVLLTFKFCDDDVWCFINIQLAN